MNAATVDAVAQGPFALCQAPHVWAFQYGAPGAGPCFVERYYCTACLATLDARRPPMVGVPGQYPGARGA